MLGTKKLWQITIGVVSFVIFVVLWAFFIGFSSGQSGKFFNNNNNAVWIGHEWVGENKSDSDIQSLVNDFEKHKIGTVFVHAGPFLKDGTITIEDKNGNIQTTKFDDILSASTYFEWKR